MQSFKGSYWDIASGNSRRFLNMLFLNGGRGNGLLSTPSYLPTCVFYSTTKDILKNCVLRSSELRAFLIISMTKN
eukprot:1134501-Amphidinium_carterae.1